MKSFAVFDIDGTLIRWQLYHAVVDRLAKKNLLGPDTHEKLHDARMVWKRRETDTAFMEYEKLLIRAYEDALPKLPAKSFDAIVEEIATEYQEQVYTYTRGLAASLKKQDYVLIAISGSYDELVARIARRYGFDLWCGTIYKRSGGRFTGEKLVPSFDKKKTLLQFVKEHGLSFERSVGVGDSISDVAFLKLVETPIAFNPTSELFDIARSSGWKIVMERKNVVYELEQNDGKYLLAEAD